MAKKKKESRQIKSIYLFIGKQPSEEIVDDKLWLVIDRTHGMRIPCTQLIVNFDPRLQRLTVFQKGTKIYDHRARYGSAFEIKFPQNAKKTWVSMLRYPHGKENIIPWLCGYTDPDSRTTSRKEFNRLRKQSRNEFGIDSLLSRNEINHRGTNYRLYVAIKDGKCHFTAAYINPNIKDDEISKILGAYRNPYFPQEFMQHVLSTQLQLKKEAIAAIV